MEVIRHETVRNCFNGTLAACTQKLIACGPDDITRCEVSVAPERVHREEDADWSDVLGRGKARRAAVIHARGGSKTRAGRSAKASRSNGTSLG
jgi:hypothetical protein